MVLGCSTGLQSDTLLLPTSMARMPWIVRQRRIPACNFVVVLGDDESGMGPSGSHPSVLCSSDPHVFRPCRSRLGPTVAWHGTARFEPFCRLYRCEAHRRRIGTVRFEATLEYKDGEPAAGGAKLCGLLYQGLRVQREPHGHDLTPTSTSHCPDGRVGLGYGLRGLNYHNATLLAGRF